MVKLTRLLAAIAASSFLMIGFAHAEPQKTAEMEVQARSPQTPLDGGGKCSHHERRSHNVADGYFIVEKGEYAPVFTNTDTSHKGSWCRWEFGDYKEIATGIVVPTTVIIVARACSPSGMDNIGRNSTSICKGYAYMQPIPKMQ